MSSLRVATHTTGAPSRIASAATTSCSGYSPALPPKPPPTGGVTTRTRLASTPSPVARSWRNRCGIWVAPYTSRRPSACTTAAAACGSIGATAMRWFTRRARTTTSASPNTASTGALRSTASVVLRATLSGRSSNSAGAPAAKASSGSTAASSACRCTTTWSAASRAASALWATTTATASPTNRTRSTASGGRANTSSTFAMPWNPGNPRSAAVKTPTTPGAARAPARSMPSISACAASLRTNTACSVFPSPRSPRSRSARYCTAPVSRSGSSVRSTRVPRMDPAMRARYRRRPSGGKCAAHPTCPLRFGHC